MTITKLAEDLVAAKLIWDTASYQYYAFDTTLEVDPETHKNFIYAAEQYRTALLALTQAVLKQKIH